MQEVKAWLKSGKDFEVGKSLYMKYGTNSFFKSLLNNQGATPYNIKKLGADLKALAPASSAISLDAPLIQIDESVPLTSSASIPDADQTDRRECRSVEPDQQPTPTTSTSEYPIYLGLKEYIQTLYRQLERNRAELDLGTNKKLLHLTAKQILSLHAKIQGIWMKIDYYDEHNCFPTVYSVEEIIRTPKEEIQLLRQSTCKAKNRLNSSGCQNVEATKALIENNNKRIIELGGKVKR
jgi:hypothetical protein